MSIPSLQVLASEIFFFSKGSILCSVFILMEMFVCECFRYSRLKVVQSFHWGFSSLFAVSFCSEITHLVTLYYPHGKKIQLCSATLTLHISKSNIIKFCDLKSHVCKHFFMFQCSKSYWIVHLRLMLNKISYSSY